MTDVTPDHHREILRNVFVLKRMANQGEWPGVAASQVDKCLALIERRVPVSMSGPMPCFLEATGWYVDLRVRELFAAYVRAGYIELNRAPPGVALPLEAAIGKGHIDFFRAAMDCGADESLVPTANNRIRYQGCWDEGDDDDKPYEVRDIHELIADEVTSPEIRAAMLASLRETAMNRRILESSSAPKVEERGASSTGSPQQSPRRRRASL